MSGFGWGDPVDSEILVAYRRKGERRQEKFFGPVYLIGPGTKLTHVPREELSLSNGLLDLTRAPVVSIGGKRKRQPDRALGFLSENPGFEGAILLYPGSGNWDLGEGMIFLTSRDILTGKRVSGGRPVEQLVNHRWLRDGRYVADWATTLHGKVIKILREEVEQEPGPEKLAEELTGFGSQFRPPLFDICEAVRSELSLLEHRRVMLSGEQARDTRVWVRESLLEKLRVARVRKAADIPSDITISAEEVAPELVSERDTLGTVVLPGVGRRLAKREYAKFGFGHQALTVELTVRELRSVTSWPHAAVYPVLAELGDQRDQLEYGLEDALRAPEAERIVLIREYYRRRSLETMRGCNYPQDVTVADPHNEDPPPTPDPVVWGTDILSGEEWRVYAALVHRVAGVKGGIVDYGWSIRWFDDAAEAAEADAKGRREAESFMTARRLEAELTVDAKAMELPVAPPEKFKHDPAWSEADAKAAETAHITKVWTFIDALQDQPACACLPFSLLSEVSELRRSTYVYAGSEVVAKLQAEWGKAEALLSRKARGEILVNFGGHYRVMGATGQRQYWVVQPNGSTRDADEVDYRKRYTSEGEKHWRLVGPSELALTWSKAFTAADHEFVVSKLPVGGCTPEQLSTIERLEREIEQEWRGSTGMSGTRSPEIGVGWNLRKQPSPVGLQKPTPSPAAEPQRKLTADEVRAQLANLNSGKFRIR